MRLLSVEFVHFRLSFPWLCVCLMFVRFASDETNPRERKIKKKADALFVNWCCLSEDL